MSTQTPPHNQLTKNPINCPEPTPLGLARALSVLFWLREDIEADVRQVCYKTFGNTDKTNIRATRENEQNIFRIPLDKVLAEAPQEEGPYRTRQHVEEAIDLLTGRGDIVIRVDRCDIDVCLREDFRPERDGYQSAPEAAEVIGVDVSSD